MRIMLDLDGVMCDFTSGMCKAHHRPYPYDDDDNLNRRLADVWGMTAKEFWAPGNSVKWWADLGWLPDGPLFWQLACDTVGISNVCILSATSLSPNCVKGKTVWLNKHLPNVPHLLGPGKAKPFCAAPDTILIDDTEKNVDAFQRAGGRALLVPRPWNREFKYSTESHARVSAQLKEMMR